MYMYAYLYMYMYTYMYMYMYMYIVLMTCHAGRSFDRIMLRGGWRLIQEPLPPEEVPQLPSRPREGRWPCVVCRKSRSHMRVLLQIRSAASSSGQVLGCDRSSIPATGLVLRFDYLLR